MHYKTIFNFITVKFLLLLIISILFSCNKEKQAPEQADRSYAVSEQWEIDADNRLSHNDGIIYKDEYLVFSELSAERMLKSYDILSKKKVWEYDISGTPGSGQEMSIYEEHLVLFNQYTGVSVFDLKQKELVASLKFEALSLSPPAYYEGEVYIAVQDHFYTKFTIKSINIKNGEINDVYEWPLNKDLHNRLTSPLMYRDEAGRKNFVTLLQVYDKEEGADLYDKAVLISVNEEHTINWRDTLDNISWSSLPVRIENNIVVNYAEKLSSYNIYTGEKNWVKTVPFNKTRLISKNNELYSELGPNSNFAKFNANTGETIWDINLLPVESTFVDFELFDNHMVVVNNNMGPLYMFNNTSGKKVKVDNKMESGMTNPKFYAEDSLFITHQYDKIIGFKLNAVN